MCDGLTGLANRRGFDQTLEREFARSVRENTSLSLLLVDVDNFKLYNDAYGHPGGDRCLQRIAAEFQNVMRRPADMTARYGGEEFAGILPNTSGEGAIEVAENLRLAIRDLNIPHSGRDDGIVTVSVGVCSVSGGQNCHTPGELLRRADKALYSAKAGGRDRVQRDIVTVDRTEKIKSLMLH